MNGFHDRPQTPRLPFVSPSTEVRFLPFGEGGVLFLPGTRRIWVLNAASACIWCLLDEVDGPEELVSAMVARFPIDEATARRDAHAALAVFAQEGLLEGGEPASLPEEPELLDPPEHGGVALGKTPDWVERHFFRTPGGTFEFCSTEAATGAEFAEIMEPLAVARQGVADTHLAAVQSRRGGSSLDLYLNGRRRLAGVLPERALPHLFALFCRQACESLGENLLLHAAVVGRKGQAVLFPAEAGRGKTTLAAVLATQGFTFFTDELAVLDVADLGVLPLPLPMTVKAGSLPVLEGLYPGLFRSSVHLRTDGLRVRYLPPPPSSLPSNLEQKAIIRAAIFPRFEPGIESHLKDLDKVEALQRLARTGSSIRDYRTGDIEAMIAVVEQNPCFELVYGDPMAAASLLEERIFRQWETFQ